MTTFAAKSGQGSSEGEESGCSVTPQQRYPKLAKLIDYLLSLKGRADLKTLDRLLIEANITKADIESCCTFGTKAYRRNTIASSDQFELLALTWRSGHCTPIHDHAGVSCAFRVVHGTGTEIRFVNTPSGMICPVGATQMMPGYICSAEEADIHQVANMQAPGEDLVTLHIYSPKIKKMKTYQFSSSEGAENCEAYSKPGV
jgi:cysteine dioxygenase